jgi:hypothetical protein
MPCGSSISLYAVNSYIQGEIYGSNAIVRARLIMVERPRWWRAQLPEMRDGRILPRSVKKPRKNVAFL